MTTTATDRHVELERLRFRLEDGFDKIAQAAQAGQDTKRWEDVWLKLLAEYEALYDQLSGSTR
jgi:hypothetical protein